MLPVTSCIMWAVVAVVGSAKTVNLSPKGAVLPTILGWACTICPLRSPARPWHFKVGKEKSLSWGFTQPRVLPAKWVGV